MLRFIPALIILVVVSSCLSKKYTADFQNVNSAPQSHQKMERGSSLKRPQSSEEDSITANNNESVSEKSKELPSSSLYSKQYSRIDSLHAARSKEVKHKNPKRIKSNQKRNAWPMVAVLMIALGGVMALFGILPLVAGIMACTGVLIGLGYLVQQAISKGGKRRWLKVLGAVLLTGLCTLVFFYFRSIWG